MYGPTVGDKIRLADTELFAEIERDFTVYGEENKFGGGKTLRDGMAQSATHLRDEGVLDLVITNATIIDYWGIVKADIGIKDGKIAGIGKAGNPNTMDGVTSGMVIGASTEALGGEGHIFTAGGIDTHIHFICPQQIETALAGGITTFIGGGTGPNHGTLATTITPGAWNIRKMFEALDGLPMNFGIFGKGNSSSHEAIIEQIEAGVFFLMIRRPPRSTLHNTLFPYTTQDGTTWTSQGVLPTSYFNKESSVVVRFLTPVEAKGIKIAAVTPSGISGYFGIGELTFYAEN